MLSIDRCREILKSADYDLANDEISQLRDFLYQFASYQIDCEFNSDNY